MHRPLDGEDDEEVVPRPLVERDLQLVNLLINAHNTKHRMENL